MDHCRVRLDNFISSDFADESNGVAQGKKASVHKFNTAASIVKDFIEESSIGVGIPSCKQCGLVLKQAHSISPANYDAHDIDTAFAYAPALAHSLQSTRAAAKVLATLPAHADRAAAVELINPDRLVCIQIVDDTVGPTSSAQQCRMFWQACEAYTNTHGPVFNLGKTKSAILPIGAPEDETSRLASCSYMDKPIPVASNYIYMGIMFDHSLSMATHLDYILARMAKSFDEQVGSGSNAGIPMPLLATIASQGPEATGFYGLPFCIIVPNAESRFNHLQVEWCKTYLGIRGLPQGCWLALLAECGFTQRLGTKMLGAAIMLEARVLLSPADAPPRRLLAAAKTFYSAPSWAQAVSHARSRLGPLPDICDFLGEAAVQDALHDRASRKIYLSKYKN